MPGAQERTRPSPGEGPDAACPSPAQPAGPFRGALKHGLRIASDCQLGPELKQFQESLFQPSAFHKSSTEKPFRGKNGRVLPKNILNGKSAGVNKKTRCYRAEMNKPSFATQEEAPAGLSAGKVVFGVKSKRPCAG